jgi:hypothetical protein
MFHWLSCTQFTIRVATDSAGVIREAAPIAQRFLGQPIDNLTGWMRKLGDFRHHTDHHGKITHFDRGEPMATATKPVAQDKSKQSLWGPMRIPIILISGEVNSGKTLFYLNIDPDCRTRDHDPTTIVWDQEGSAESYESFFNIRWLDTRAAVMEGVHRKVFPAQDTDPLWRQILLKKPDVNNSPSASLFRAWYLSLLKIEPKQYRVGACDTFTPLQEGLVEWLKMHPEAFGRTANQYEKMASTYLWPDVKSVLSYILATDCRLRFETFVLTVHLKNEWEGNSKTGNRIAEGLDVLSKLATLHLELDRKPKTKGKEAPRVPAGILMKERLLFFGASADEDKPVLPPRLPEASPNAIRNYILSPPDFSNLKPAERVVEETMTDDQRLQLQARIAEANKETAQAELSKLEQMKAAAAKQREAHEASQQQSADQKREEKVAKIDQQIAEHEANSPLCTQAQRDEIYALLPQAFGNDIAPWQGVMKAYGVEHITLLSKEQAAESIDRLKALLAKRANGHCSPDQINKIKTVAARIGFPDIVRDKWLQARGYSRYEDMTLAHGQELFDMLQKTEDAVDPIPF